MNERVTRLRQQSLDAIPCVSLERARIVTEAQKNLRNMPVPLQRAMVFKALMEQKAICINPDELIVGERGPLPKHTPTYPELCCHSKEDLRILNSREKIPYAIDESSMQYHVEEILPFWQGNTMRDLIFREMAPEWKACYEAGVFTEFMEQRAPGHTVLDDKIYRKGFVDFKREIRQSLEALDFLNDPDAYDKKQQLLAMEICADAIITYAKRHADKALELASSEEDPARRQELRRIADVCTRVPAHAPSDFWEALQCYWFVHLGVITEMNTWDSFCPGRLDQHLLPFYQKGLKEGTLSRESARELLQCFWVKFNNHPAPPKVGVTASESATYTDFANINLGGLKPDGSDGVNEVTYLLLEVIDEMRLLQPSSNIQLSKKNPDLFLKKACEVIRKGWGQPSVFNADSVVQELLNQGKALEDARSGGTSGCVETGAFGKEAYILTGYFNIPKVLELTLNNGIDARTGQRIGIETGDATRFTSFEELYAAFERQMRYLIDVKIRGNNVIEKLYAQFMPAPFLSILIDDCITKAKDYNAGGARYNSSYIQGVGLGTITDSITAIRYHVFDQANLSMESLLRALGKNFEGESQIRLLLLNKTPKYGNDDDYADSVMTMVFNSFHRAVDGRKNIKGGHYHINMLPTTCHVYFGSVVGATPDGRRAWEPLSEGVSPVQGADRKGPTAVIKSVSKMDHLKTGGTLLNMKFTPQLLEGDDGLTRLMHLIRAYFKLDGHHVQFNVVKAETLRKAQAEPEKYRDLIVRVAGYSDYFCDLTKTLQDEIIRRTEHVSF